jgi:hypothetical protein
MARPSEYDFELCKEICNIVADGFNIKTVLSSKQEYPDFSTWCRWRRENEELHNLYIKSIQDKSESVDEEIDNIMYGLKNGEYEPAQANVLIQTLKWKAAKYYPKMFGEKLDVTSDNKPISSPPIFGENPLDAKQ